MALFMGCALITFLSGIGIYGGAKETYRIVYPYVFFTALVLFPLFYIYILQIVNPEKISPKLLRHLIPGILLVFTSFTLYVIMMNKAEQLFYIQEFLLSSNPPADAHWKFHFMKKTDRLAKLLYIFFSVIYYILTLRLVNRHQKRIEDYYSSLKGVSLSWVKVISVVFVLALFSGISVHWFPRLNVLNSPFLSSVPFILLGTFFAMVGNYSNRQAIIIFPSEKVDESETEGVSLKKEIPTEEIDRKIETETIETETPEIPPELKEKLENYIREYRPFLNPELKIWDIARDLNTNRTYISRLINHIYGQRFSTFINFYRIEESKRLMTDPETQNYSLTVLASMSGFLNYSSFVRAFKTFENITPNEFRQSIPDAHQ
jgi:AraC-like DNA-binding protein